MQQQMKIRAKKAEILDALRTNLKKHSQIVQEAREGYVQQAQDALKKKMKQLKEGKIVSLLFSLRVPQDHSIEYETAIKMLELDVGEFVDLTTEQVQCLIQDQWGWKRTFLTSNSGYSLGARTELGEEEDDE
jgi:hypothetical protein